MMTTLMMMMIVLANAKLIHLKQKKIFKYISFLASVYTECEWSGIEYKENRYQNRAGRICLHLRL